MSVKKENLLVIGLLFIYSIYAVLTLSVVPFHPDETTQIYMSTDVDKFWSNPNSIYYSPKNQIGPEMHLRLIDAPFGRSMIFLGRKAAGLAPLKNDWNWSLSWAFNRTNGAYPDVKLLFISRLFCFIGIPFGLYFFYRTLRIFSSIPVSIVCLILLSFSSEFFLHTRRAMAEPWMMSLFLISLWCVFSKPSKTVWILTCFSLPILVQTKQLVIPYAMIAGLIILLRTIKYTGARIGIRFAVILILVTVCLTALLNPVGWGNPVKTIQASISERQIFNESMFNTLSRVHSGLAMPTLPSRLIGLISQMFFAPPAYTDGGTFIQEIRLSLPVYQKMILTEVFSGLIWGVILLTFSVSGFVIGLIKIFKSNFPIRQEIIILLVITLGQLVFYLSIFNFAFQRYYLLLFPLVILWISVGLGIVTGKKVR